MKETDYRKALAVLVLWSTGGNRVGNPYCVPAVKEALAVLGTDEREELETIAAGQPFPGETFEIVLSLARQNQLT